MANDPLYIQIYFFIMYATTPLAFAAIPLLPSDLITLWQFIFTISPLLFSLVHTCRQSLSRTRSHQPYWLKASAAVSCYYRCGVFRCPNPRLARPKLAGCSPGATGVLVCISHHRNVILSCMLVSRRGQQCAWVAGRPSMFCFQPRRHL
ncbi:uncharacterized protein HD556DRAFT_494714 [Suillus plorans]|uniref:Uncharacterized protein n=1 Tax=Suillus plorans TaxID=116603 RepID=A0A9P7DWX0_9AGAM|nr:uncharacterized protein HD556DRAFT_494714 [Suillus plorans]KAG1804956.1 hypothetical protein HD556DRAFT_494714 [Suillus plorans]